MKFTVVMSLFFFLHNVYAVPFESEALTWSTSKDWATLDKETHEYYRYLPMTESTNDFMAQLDRRFNYICQVKSKDLRRLMYGETVVIAVYAIKDCEKDGRNPNW